MKPRQVNIFVAVLMLYLKVERQTTSRDGTYRSVDRNAYMTSALCLNFMDSVQRTPIDIRIIAMFLN